MSIAMTPVLRAVAFDRAAPGRIPCTMKNRRNYYRILHVSPDAPTPVIRASYRALMQALRMHPDIGGDHETAVLLNEAYATLTDPGRRAAYDRSLARPSQQRGTPREAPAEHAPPARPSAPRAGGGCGFCGIALRPLQDDHPDSECHACASPLFPAPKHRDGAEARRAIGRLPRTVAVTFQLSSAPRVVHAGTTSDLSLNGMRLSAPVQMAVGDRLRVECAFCRAVAVVRSVQAVAVRGRRGWQYGIEFVTLRITRERGGLVSTVA